MAGARLAEPALEKISAATAVVRLSSKLSEVGIGVATNVPNRGVVVAAAVADATLPPRTGRKEEGPGWGSSAGAGANSGRLLSSSCGCE